MPDTVNNELAVFIWSVCAGALIALIFDLFRIKRKAIKTGLIFTILEDMLYWIIVIIIMFSAVYLSNDGQFRGYIFLGACLGASIYLFTASPIIIKSSLFIIKVITIVITKIIEIISVPIKIGIRLIKTVAKILNKAFSISYKKCGKGLNKVSTTCKKTIKQKTLKIKPKFFKKKT